MNLPDKQDKFEEKLPEYKNQIWNSLQEEFSLTALELFGLFIKEILYFTMQISLLVLIFKCIDLVQPASFLNVKVGNFIFSSTALENFIKKNRQLIFISIALFLVALFITKVLLESLFAKKDSELKIKIREILLKSKKKYNIQYTNTDAIYSCLINNIYQVIEYNISVQKFYFLIFIRTVIFLYILKLESLKATLVFLIYYILYFIVFMYSLNKHEAKILTKIQGLGKNKNFPEVANKLVYSNGFESKEDFSIISKMPFVLLALLLFFYFKELSEYFGDPTAFGNIASSLPKGNIASFSTNQFLFGTIFQKFPDTLNIIILFTLYSLLEIAGINLPSINTTGCGVFLIFKEFLDPVTEEEEVIFEPIKLSRISDVTIYSYYDQIQIEFCKIKELDFLPGINFIYDGNQCEKDILVDEFGLNRKKFNLEFATTKISMDKLKERSLFISSYNLNELSIEQISNKFSIEERNKVFKKLNIDYIAKRKISSASTSEEEYQRLTAIAILNEIIKNKAVFVMIDFKIFDKIDESYREEIIKFFEKTEAIIVVLLPNNQEELLHVDINKKNILHLTEEEGELLIKKL